METTTARIVDAGRRPQIEGHRLTVMDVFYYLHRRRVFEHIQQAMPSLTRDQLDAVVEYVNAHREELVEKDREVEEGIARDIAKLRIKGLRHELDDSIPIETRAALLKEKLGRQTRRTQWTNG